MKTCPPPALLTNAEKQRLGEIAVEVRRESWKAVMGTISTVLLAVLPLIMSTAIAIWSLALAAFAISRFRQSAQLRREARLIEAQASVRYHLYKRKNG